MHSQFQQGRAARLAGKRLTDNPHQSHDQEYNDWHDGWTSQPRPCYYVRDNGDGRKHVFDLTYAEASALATELTQAVGHGNDRTSDGLDRFTVHRDYD